MAIDGQYSTKKELIFCNPKIRGGMTVCFFDERCSTCDFAKKYEDAYPKDVSV